MSTLTPDYAAVRQDIKSILPNMDWDDSCFIGPVLIRLSWHASGTYDRSNKTGGSQGATMRFKPESADPENAGLEHARAFLEPIKAKYPWISYADLWTLAGVVSVEAMGGPQIQWTPGRVDKPIFNRTDSGIETSLPKTDIAVPENGRLPQAALGADHIRQVFGRMGFNDQETVALIGAHCVGRCHKDRSGYEGPWTNTPILFSNTYYQFLCQKNWIPKVWDGPLQYVDANDVEQFAIMLPSDMALLNDPQFSYYVHKYAEDETLWRRHFAEAYGKLLNLGRD